MRVATRLMSSGQRLNLAGMFPPIPTPFDENGDIHLGRLDQNLEKWQKNNFSGYVVMGSNGEFPYLETEEKVSLLQAVKKRLRSDQLLLAGTGCESTRATLRLTEAAAKAGADAALVYTPCFYKNAMTPPALISHFEKVADASPLPVILYNVPPNTGIEMSAETILALVNHPNIIGLKDSGGDVEKMGRVVSATKGSGFQVLAGSAGFLLKALEVGCVGGVCAAANVFGPQVMELMAAYNDGQMEKANKLQEILVKPNAAITRELGVPGLKTAMEWMGYFGGPVRPPLIPLDQAQKSHLKAVLEEARFLP